MGRKSEIKRRTNEVDISGFFSVDGSGRADVKTGVDPLDHLLTLFSFHGFFDLTLEASGDLRHHIVEDIGISLGKAFKQALGDKEGIRRYGCFSLVMDEVVVEVNVDISGRPLLKRVIIAGEKEKEDILRTISTGKFDDSDFNCSGAEDFLNAFVQHSGITLVYLIKSGAGDTHHLLEALFKAMGKALDEATTLDSRRKGVPSTKGIID